MVQRIELSPEHERALLSDDNTPESLQRLALQTKLARIEQQVQDGTIGSKLKKVGKFLAGPALGGAAMLAINAIGGPVAVAGTIGSGISSVAGSVASVAGSVASVIPSSVATTAGGAVAGSAALRVLSGSSTKRATTAVSQSKIESLRTQIDALDARHPVAPSQPVSAPKTIPVGILEPDPKKNPRVRRARAVNNGQAS